MQPATKLDLITIKQEGNVFQVGPVRLTLTVEEITPERAAKDLANRAKNRTLTRKKASEYGRDMTLGCFGLTGESIIYDWHGRMQDGQHRLQGVVDSGKSIWAVVVRGIDPSQFYRIDSGKMRSMGDVENIKGRKAPGIYAAALRLLHLYNNGGLGALNPVRATNDELELHEALYPDLERSLVARSWPRRIIQPSVAVCFHFLFAQSDGEAADTFFKKLGSGADLSEGNPIHTLRNRIVQEHKLDKRIPPVQLYAWIIKAWNAYVQRRELQRVHWGPHESFPTLYKGVQVSVKARKGG